MSSTVEGNVVGMFGKCLVEVGRVVGWREGVNKCHYDLFGIGVCRICGIDGFRFRDFDS